MISRCCARRGSCEHSFSVTNLTGRKGEEAMPTFCALIRLVGAALIGMLCATGAARAQAPGPVQPWGLPPLPAGAGPVEKFADVSGTPQGQFLEGGRSILRGIYGSSRS